MKTHWLLSLTCLLALGAGAWLSADDAEEATDEAQETAAKSEETYCSDLRTAADLVRFGRENDAPEALICAARIIGTTPTTEDTDNFTCVTEHAEEPQPGPTAEDLLAEAAELSDAEHIQTLIAQVEDIISNAERGNVTGPGHVHGAVVTYGTEEWHGDFYGNEWAEVTVVGDGVSDLDVRVYDDLGYLIAEDNSTSPDCHVHWFQRYTGHVHIEVSCYSSPYSHVHYTVYHN
jgi:hypothetical protein